MAGSTFLPPRLCAVPCSVVSAVWRCGADGGSRRPRRRRPLWLRFASARPGVCAVLKGVRSGGVSRGLSTASISTLVSSSGWRDRCHQYWSSVTYLVAQGSFPYPNRGLFRMRHSAHYGTHGWPRLTGVLLGPRRQNLHGKSPARGDSPQLPSPP